MNNNHNILKAFNSHLIDFIIDIISVFPENQDLKVTKTVLETWRRINPKSIITIWKTCVTDKYSKEIETGDYNYFMKKNYTQDISGCDNEGEVLKAINNLRTPISLMSENNKEKAIKYTQNLTKLSKIYFTPS